MMGKFWYSVCDKVQGRGEFCEFNRNIKLCVTIFVWSENTCASNFHNLKNYWLFLYFRTLMVTSSASCSIWRIAVFALLNRIRIHS